MAEVLISPGATERENDQSFLTQLPTSVGQAIVGPTAKGKVNIPKIVTTYSDYLTNFGSTFASGSDTYTYFTSVAAYNYFQNGGTSLLVTRVQSGSWSPATASIKSGSTEAFQLEFLSDGTIGNSVSTEVSGTLPSGSKDNIRWEIVSPNTSSGTFSLLVRRGDDSTQSKIILETFTNLSLDPNTSNYIAKVIGDITQTVMGSGADTYLQTTGSYRNASNYIRVKSVSLPTPNYLNNYGATSSLVYSNIIANLVGSGAFAGGTGTCAGTGTSYFNELINGTNSQGLVGDNYTTAFNLLANRDDFRFNVITAPGLYYADYSTALNTLISNVEDRGDAIVVADPVAYGSTATAATTQASNRNSSYTAMYWPWVQTTDPDLGKLVWVPASTMIPGVYAYNDRVGEPWFAPAGINRGGLGNVVQAERK